MKRKQSGLSLVGFLVVLAVVGFAAYVGMKLFPMYQEYYSVTSAMKGLANEPGVADMAARGWHSDSPAFVVLPKA